MTQPSKPVGAEYVCVPREPTYEMLAAGVIANQKRMVADVYKAMLAASPPPAMDAGVIDAAYLFLHQIKVAERAGADLSFFKEGREALEKALASAPAGSGGDVIRRTLREHWLVEIRCDHERSTDRAVCSCSMWRGDEVMSVGEAVEDWIGHVIAAAGLLKGAEGSVAAWAKSEDTKELQEIYDLLGIGGGKNLPPADGEGE